MAIQTPVLWLEATSQMLPQQSESYTHDWPVSQATVQAAGALVTKQWRAAIAGWNAYAGVAIYKPGK